MTDLEQLLAQFQTDLVRQGRLETTVVAYARDVRRFGRWCSRQAADLARLTDLTAAHGRAYRADLQRTGGLAPSSINRHLAGLRVFLEWAVTAGHIAANPLARVTGLPAPAPQPIWLDAEQQARLEAGLARAVLAAPGLAPTLRDQTMILLLCHTGIRVGELVGLTLADVTLTEDGGSLRVRRAGQAERDLALNAVVRRALAAYLARRPGDRGAWLFIGQRGAVGPRQVQRILRKWAQAAGLPPALVTVHTLRHTFSYNLVQAGVPLDQAATLLGYTSLNPLRHYFTAPTPDLQWAVEYLVRAPTAPQPADALNRAH